VPSGSRPNSEWGAKRWYGYQNDHGELKYRDCNM